MAVTIYSEGKLMHRDSSDDNTSTPYEGNKNLDRRNFLSLGLGLGLGVLLNSCTNNAITRLDGSPLAPGPTSHLYATEADGIDLFIEQTPVLINGRVGSAITVNGSLPGPVIHMREGEEAVIRVHNRLKDSTSIHWHGILLPYTMDGVPGISFPGIAAGTTFTYRFTLQQNGTYWYHSHSGMQEQLGLYGMLIVEPAQVDPVAYDQEIPIVLSDWTFEDPHQVMRNLKTSEGYYNYQRQTLTNIDEQMQEHGLSLGAVLKQRLAWQRMRMDPTDISDVTGSTYQYLLNGRAAETAEKHLIKPGQRVRLRIVNASAMSYYDIRIPGLPMTIVQADGQNVQPVEVDEFRIAVAETYDVIISIPDTKRAYILFAEAMDRSGFAMATLSPPGNPTIPEPPPLRRRPLLTMADMGMMAHAGHSGHKSKMSKESHDQNMAHTQQSVENHNDHIETNNNQDKKQNRLLPVEGLPEKLNHGSSNHGPGSITMGDTAYRQLDDPGPGLGDDGRKVLTYGKLKALKPPPDRRPPTREITMHLTGNMHRYIWGFDGKKWSESDMLLFEYGERLRINFINDTMMNHPLHLHGMWMDLYANHAYHENPRKHTVNIQPAELVTVDISADAPGQWAFHCHFLYHMDMGMFRTVAVVRSLEEGPIHVR